MSDSRRLLDRAALFGGIVVSFLLTLLVLLLSPLLNEVPHKPDAGALWYYWVLAEPTFWTRLVAWSCYSCHQLCHWALIYVAQNILKLTTTSRLHLINYLCLAMNLLFCLLHMVQTHLTYDGLAQDTHIVSSMGCVVVMLIWVLLMENYSRGLFFGYPFPFSKQLIEFSRKYHAYYFSWALIYNFWYHPMEGSWGHLWGFLYKFFLLVQASLFFTKIHLNKWWKVFLEVFVAFHAVVVAMYQPWNGWPMFLSGFASIFVITQMHGLGLKFMQKVCLGLVFVVPAVWYYSGVELGRVNEPLRIPVINYIGVFILAGILYVTMKMKNLFC